MPDIKVEPIKKNAELKPYNNSHVYEHEAFDKGKLELITPLRF